MKWITWALFATLLILQYKIWLDDGGGLRAQYAQMKQQAENIKHQNANLQHNNAILRSEVDDLQNGYEAITEIARTEMGYIENGETFYNLKPE